MTKNCIVIDAIDGAGKDTLASILLQHLESLGMKAFDAISYQKEHSKLPKLDLPELTASTALLVCEPTYVKHDHLDFRLRDHIVPGSTTTQRELVHMYAEDRKALYKQLVIPYLQNGGTVVQVRGLSSSLAYQRAVDPTITIEEIMSEPGNQLEIEYAPKALVLLSLPQEIAEARRKARGEKEDPSMFDSGAIQDATHENYHSPALRSIFTDRGTAILDIDATGDIQTNTKRLLEALTPFF